MAYCERTRPCAAPTVDHARTAYPVEEVEQRRAAAGWGGEAEAEWDGEWPEYDGGMVDLDSVLRRVGHPDDADLDDAWEGEPCEDDEVDLVRTVGGTVARDEAYAGFLRDINEVGVVPAVGQAPGGGIAVPAGLVPVLAGLIWLLARVAGVGTWNVARRIGTRRGGPGDGVEAKRR